MLSVCIPIYNCNVTKLVNSLLSQLKKSTVSFQIILIDDASEIEFKEINKNLANADEIQYVQLKKNIGRAKIRNIFLSYNTFDYLLFLDCDSQINDNEFVEHYLAEVKKQKLVICGGRSYPIHKPKKTHYLRWKYGVERECLQAKKRTEKPHQSFMTNNFVISAKVLTQIPFDERLSNYGHEDTLFGFRLKQNKIPITHIDNATQHIYTESNTEFLQKTEQALKNLSEIRNFVNDRKFDQEIKLLRVYNKLSGFGIKHVLLLISFLFSPFILWLIKKNIGGLYIFDFYKLLYLSK